MNVRRGTITFEVGGVPYSARLSTNAMARYEDATGQTVLDAFSEIEKSAKSKTMPKATLLRDLMWVTIEGELTREAVGDIMDDLGYSEVYRILTEVAQSAFPQAEKATPEGNARAGKAPRQKKV